MKLNDSKIVIRPGKRYLIALFVYIYVAVIMLWSLVKVPLSEDTNGAPRVMLLIIASILGIYFLLFILFTKIELSNKKISIKQLPLKRSEYLWSEISHAKITDESFAYPCVIYAGGRRILKIPRTYFGYEQLFYELDKRNIIRKDDLYVAAKSALKIDKEGLKQ
ncbi:hypothetical protein [Lachnoanaerobaculum saburreum]|jgi:hypothetical protein|uniref:Uncharacterized protein n=1 Tax=Lachnoanaerobaculum saburreum DSM 3986 TaxID=887325 RepID=E6LJN0_9FIRM|nr:hypothetical protein [Lachnoanaerobaculum saburreum]EFU77952.1 hypothetical protein HMPREF0381_0165 [Lachnoanaerobaculum saburreum DSM 3986]RKW54560.1 MAG: hypothetical protein D8H95_09760 [Lachnospiraceae bacterium]